MSFIALLLFVLVLGVAVFWFFLDAPFGKSNESPIITVPRGMGFTQLSRELEDAGLVKNAKYLELRYRIGTRLGITSPHQAGRFIMESGQKPSQIIKNLTSPDNASRLYTELTIPPGSTSAQIAGIVHKSHLSEKPYVQSAIKKLAPEYPIIQIEEGLQGYLFPDTYRIEIPLDNSPETLQANAESIIRVMANQFFHVLDDIEPNWRKLTKSQLHEKVVLASIVEREYRVTEEAKMIAAVFNNRIKKMIPLQSCATVAYTIEDTEEGIPFRKAYVRFNRRIFEHYLEIDSPYNTYLYSSLPPASISLPSRVALEATFYPADTEALFFVVEDPIKGTHVFSTNYSDHLSAQVDYLRQYVVKE